MLTKEQLRQTSSNGQLTAEVIEAVLSTRRGIVKAVRKCVQDGMVSNEEIIEEIRKQNFTNSVESILAVTWEERKRMGVTLPKKKKGILRNLVADLFEEGYTSVAKMVAKLSEEGIKFNTFTVRTYVTDLRRNLRENDPESWNKIQNSKNVEVK